MSYIGLDLDGTILNYNAHASEIRTNPALLSMLPRHADVVIISNQGGLPFGRITAEQIVKRLTVARRFLDDGGHSLLWCYFSIYHPRADSKSILNAAKRLRHMLMRDLFKRGGMGYGQWSIFTTARSRKPEPYMLGLTKIEAYYGDSPEDAAAAQAAGIPFVSVPRFE